MVEQARRLVHQFGGRGEAVLGLGVLLHRMVAPNPGWVLPPGFNFLETLRGVFPEKLTMTVNHHKSTPCQFGTEHITLCEHSAPHGHINTNTLNQSLKVPKS